MLRPIVTAFRIQKILNPYNFLKYLIVYYSLSKELQIKLKNGLKLIIRGTKTGEKQMFPDIFVNNEYTPKGMKISDTTTILDIGGQVGLFAIFAAMRAPHSKIISYEPVPENIQRFKNHLNLNNIHNVLIEDKAVSDKKGQKIFYYDSENYGGHGFYVMKKSKSFTVQCVTLSEIFKKHKLSILDFLKIDCEGAEYEILYNLPSNIFKKIKFITLEYHNLDTNTKNDFALSTFLKQHGFKLSYNKETPVIYAYNTIYYK